MTKKIRRWLKWLIGIAVVYFSAPLWVMPFIDQDAYKQRISDAVEAQSGRPLIIAGNLRLAFGIVPRIHAGQVRYPNAAWTKRAWAVEVKKAVVGVDVPALIGGKLSVKHVILHQPRLHIEKNADGVFNIAPTRKSKTDADADTNKDGASKLPAVNLASLRIIGGEILTVTRRREWNLRIDDARAESIYGRAMTVDFRGALEDTPLNAIATTGSLRALIAKKRMPLSMRGTLGGADNRLRAHGEVGKLLTWRDVDLQFTADIARVDAFSALAQRNLPHIGGISGQFRIDQPDRIDTLAVRDIDLTSRELGLQTTMRGAITKVRHDRDMNLQIESRGQFRHPFAARLAQFGGWVDENYPQLPFAAVARARLRGPARAFNIAVDHAEFGNAAMQFKLRGAVDVTEGKWSVGLPIEFMMPGDAPQNPPLPDMIKADGKLTRAPGAWRLNDVNMTLTREGLRAQLQGEISELRAQPVGRAKLIADLADARHLKRFFAHTLPPLSKMKLAADVDFGDGGMRAKVEKFDGRVYDIDVSIEGDIDKLHRFRGVDLQVNARAAGLQKLPRIVGWRWPHSNIVRASAQLRDDADGAFHLNHFYAAVVGAPLELNARGGFRNLGAGLRADLALDLTLHDGTAINSVFAKNVRAAQFVQAVAPLTAAATLKSRSAVDWLLDDLNVESINDAHHKVNLAGDIAAFSPFDARLNVAVDGFAITRLPKSWHKLPDGKFDLAFDLSAKHGEIALANLAASLESTDAKLDLRGDIPRLAPIAIDNLELLLFVKRAGDLAWGATQNVMPDQIISARFDLQPASDGGRRSVLDLQIGDSDLRGTAHWHWADAEQPTRVVANLRADAIDLAAMLRPPKKRKRMFSSAPLLPNTLADWLGNLNARVNLSADHVANHQIRMDDVDMQLWVSNDKVHHVIGGKIGEGDVNFVFELDTGVKPYIAGFNMRGAQLDAAGLSAFSGGGFIEGGEFVADVELKSRGISMAELAANADGRVFLRLDRARMKNQSLDIIGGDIFTNVINAVNPFRSVGEYVDVECGVIKFTVKNGNAVSKKGLAMRTDKVALLASGGIDLADESLKILISPKARKGLGINPVSLAKALRLGGTLTKPKIEADASKLWESGATVWAAVYTGGWSLLAQGLFDRNRANIDVCKVAAE